MPKPGGPVLELDNGHQNIPGLIIPQPTLQVRLGDTSDHAMV